MGICEAQRLGGDCTNSIMFIHTCYVHTYTFVKRIHTKSAGTGLAGTVLICCVHTLPLSSYIYIHHHYLHIYNSARCMHTWSADTSLAGTVWTYCVTSLTSRTWALGQTYRAVPRACSRANWSVWVSCLREWKYVHVSVGMYDTCTHVACAHEWAHVACTHKWAHVTCTHEWVHVVCTCQWVCMTRARI